MVLRNASMNSGDRVSPPSKLSDVSSQSTLPSFLAMKPSRLAAMWIVTRESVTEPPLQHDKRQPPSELEADPGHPRHLDKPAALVETDRARVLAVDGRHHDALPAGPGSLA